VPSVRAASKREISDYHGGEYADVLTASVVRVMMTLVITMMEAVSTS
jgi:hypothetical protein